MVLLITIVFSCQKKTEIQTVSENSTKALPEWAFKKYPFLQNKIAITPKSSSASRSITPEEIETLQQLEARPIKIKFKWDGCDRPLGICILIPIGSIVEDVQEANVAATDHFMSIQSDYTFWFEDGTVPITDDIIVDDAICEQLSYRSIKILKGLYEMADTEKGQVFVEIETTK